MSLSTDKEFDRFVGSMLEGEDDDIEAESVESTHLQTDIAYTCAYCFSENPTQADPTAGRFQSYTEDCQTCCRPNTIRLSWDEASQDWWVETEPES